MIPKNVYQRTDDVENKVGEVVTSSDSFFLGVVVRFVESYWASQCRSL